MWTSRGLQGFIKDSTKPLMEAGPNAGLGEFGGGLKGAGNRSSVVPGVELDGVCPDERGSSLNLLVGAHDLRDESRPLRRAAEPREVSG